MTGLRKALGAAALAVVLLAALSVFVPVKAQHGVVCGQRDAMVQRLEAQFGETRRGFGLQRGSSVVEVFASSESGSWTILVTQPSGMACMVAAGQNWTPVEKPKKTGLPI